jgi:hypothetical protein
MKRLGRLLGALALVAWVTAATHASVFRDWLHGMRRHDGFYLRGHVGFGYGMLSAMGGVDMDGAALALGAEIGAMVGGEVGLHLALWSSILTDPGVDNFFEGAMRGEASCALTGIGPGLVLYVGDTDLWFTANAGAVIGDIASPVVSDVFGTHVSRADGTVGFGIQSAVGKSFWVGAETQLGLAFSVGFAAVPLESGDGGATYLSFSLAGNVTFD